MELLVILLLVCICGVALGVSAGIGYGLFDSQRSKILRTLGIPFYDAAPGSVASTSTVVPVFVTPSTAEEEINKIHLSAELAQIVIAATRTVVPSDKDVFNKAVDGVLANPGLLLKEHSGLWREVATAIIAARDLKQK